MRKKIRLKELRVCDFANANDDELFVIISLCNQVLNNKRGYHFVVARSTRYKELIEAETKLKEYETKTNLPSQTNG